jgi:hypothetical protein
MMLPFKLSDWPEDWKFLFNERAGIMEFDGGFSKAEAEYEAEKDIRKQAMNSQFPKVSR